MSQSLGLDGTAGGDYSGRRRPSSYGSSAYPRRGGGRRQPGGRAGRNTTSTRAAEGACEIAQILGAAPGQPGQWARIGSPSNAPLWKRTAGPLRSSCNHLFELSCAGPRWWRYKSRDDGCAASLRRRCCAPRAYSDVYNDLDQEIVGLSVRSASRSRRGAGTPRGAHAVRT